MKSMVDKTYRLTAIFVLLAGIQGCSVLSLGKSSYACPGGVEGVRCLSARQVYKATESSDYVKPNNPDEKDKGTASKSVPAGSLQRTSQVAVPRIQQPIPIRTQAKVMRIWMTPWEDDDGDLHADGFIYTEIEGRRWNLGDKFMAPGTTISPLSVSTPNNLSVK
jgi:conjugal transfer pilus assembly protein TraV